MVQISRLVRRNKYS